jgi:phosphoribosylformylglycinamidine cyclo-ligase
VTSSDKAGLQIGDLLPGTAQSVADSLLAVHRSYFKAITPVIDRMHGLAHITGGGIPGNLVRILPKDAVAVVDPTAWERPPLFRFLQQSGQVGDAEMHDVFNLGIGMIAVLPQEAVIVARDAADADGVETRVIGHIRPGPCAVTFATH